MKHYIVKLSLAKGYGDYYGGGYVYSPNISIPKEIVKRLGWSKNTKLRLTFDEENKRLMIEEAD
jgi:hypothetical protein